MSATPIMPSDVEVEYESTLESVDAAEEAVLRYLQGVGLDEDEQHRFGMAVREAMVNAVVHGNRYHEDRRVRFAIRQQPGPNARQQVEVTIADEGEGFEGDTVPDPLAEENILRQSGRGILLIRAFCDEFRMQPRVPHGTVVTLVKYLQEQTQAQPPASGSRPA